MFVKKDPCKILNIFPDEHKFIIAKSNHRENLSQKVPEKYYQRFSNEQMIQYTQKSPSPQVSLGPDVDANIRNLLTDAVRKRLMSERRIGCMLSGGLDSSLIAALVVKIALEEGIKYRIQTFSIGQPGSTDLVNARKVAGRKLGV